MTKRGISSTTATRGNRRPTRFTLSICAAALVALALAFSNTPALAQEPEGLEALTPQPAWTLEIDLDRPYEEQVQPLNLTPGSATLKPGRHERWIDRYQLPQWGHDLYDLLVEGSDDDGVNDFLIEDAAFTPAAWDSEYQDYAPGRVITYDDETYAVIGEVDYDASPGEFFGITCPVMGSFVNDHPEVFWTGNRCVFLGMRFGGSEKTQFLLLGLRDGVDYDLRLEQYRAQSLIERDLTARNGQVSQILAGAKAAGTRVYDQVRFFNRWLTEHNDYNIEVTRYGDTAYMPAYRSISALKGQTGETGPVCDAYAKALKTLCDAAGIPCVYVCSENHAWNNVKVGNAWYAVDATWNDPASYVVQPARSGRETEQYLLVGSQTPDEDGVTFDKWHPVQNDVWGTSFPFATNGPELSPTAYQVPDEPDEPEVPVEQLVTVYRLRNPHTNEHLFTTSRNEYDALPNSGWEREGVAWYGLESSSSPVYRLYNPNNYDHHYTLDRNEYDTLGRTGWIKEDIAWYADDDQGIPIYRLFNPYTTGPGAHHLTTDWNEVDVMMGNGWRHEGIKLYGAIN